MKDIEYAALVVGDAAHKSFLSRMSGHDRLWRWFGTSYASWLTMPRVLMHEMPDEWQLKIAELLEQYDEAFPNPPELETRVQVTSLDGKLMKTPEWLINYRRPMLDEINKMRGGQSDEN